MRDTDDLRVSTIRPLIPPAILAEEIPITAPASSTVAEAREKIEQILAGESDRLVTVIGPCSIHDEKAALEYGKRLAEQSSRFSDELHIIMRVYFEKPRTTVGWKGLINDPDLDGTCAINRGLRIARKLLLDLAEMGVPAGHEFLDTITPQFIADLVAWAAIGARTSESQVHRQLASGLSMPVGFKNGTKGSVQIAIDAVRAAASPHQFMGVTKQGLSGIVATQGNDQCHIILRGSSQGTNYSAEHVARAAQALEKAGCLPRLMIDCNHGNSQKDARRQPAVAESIAEQIEQGSSHIMGVMIESHLVGGKQPFRFGADFRYGQSITDDCLGWDETVPVLERLAHAVRRRREGSDPGVLGA